MLKQGIQFIILSFLYWGCIVTSLYASHIFFPGDEWVTFAVILLAMVSVWLLPELLVIWMLVLSTALIVMIMVFGISYIPVPERVFYIFLLPSMGLGTLYLVRLAYRLLAGDELKAAQKKFESYQMTSESGSPMQIGMVRWAHFEQFREINPRESRRVVREVKRRLKAQPNIHDVFVLSNGTFLLFADHNVKTDALTEQLKAFLEKIPFHNRENSNAIQLQIVQEEWECPELESVLFSDLMKHLGRKLETEIITEY